MSSFSRQRNERITRQITTLAGCGLWKSLAHWFCSWAMCRCKDSQNQCVICRHVRRNCLSGFISKGLVIMKIVPLIVCVFIIQAYGQATKTDKATFHHSLNPFVEASQMGIEFPKGLHRNLTGFWQLHYPYLASDDWLEVYQFFDDSTFTFNHSGYECTRRDPSYSGMYSVHKGKLVLVITTIDSLIGGHYEWAPSGCNGSELVGFRHKTVRLTRGLTRYLPFSGIMVDSANNESAFRFSIGKEDFYKCNDNPDAFSP